MKLQRDQNSEPVGYTRWNSQALAELASKTAIAIETEEDYKVA